MNSKVQVEVEKAPTETTANLVRRFTKRVQQAGILRRARSLRYATRPQSELAKKKIALKKMAYRKDMEHKRKLGLDNAVDKKTR
jgi:ribosomal protein S21